MTNALTTILFNGSRRVRVLCTAALGAGAFTSLAYYAITNLDGLGASPNVNAVFAVSTDATAFELSLDSDLVAGAMYQVTVTALPFVSGGPLTASLSSLVAPRPNTPDPQDEPATGDLALYYYGRDLLQADSGDFAQAPTGDLATIAGRPNWTGALLRRALSDGIPWDGAYGAKPDDYVNAPPTMQLPLSARLVQQCRADDRTLSAQVHLVANQGQTVSNPSGATGGYSFQMVAQGRDGLDRATIPVPAPASA
jgi:hypothetical protein